MFPKIEKPQALIDIDEEIERLRQRREELREEGRRISKEREAIDAEGDRLRQCIAELYEERSAIREKWLPTLQVCTAVYESEWKTSLYSVVPVDVSEDRRVIWVYYLADDIELNYTWNDDTGRYEQGDGVYLQVGFTPYTKEEQP